MTFSIPDILGHLRFEATSWDPNFGSYPHGLAADLSKATILVWHPHQLCRHLQQSGTEKGGHQRPMKFQPRFCIRQHLLNSMRQLITNSTRLAGLLSPARYPRRSNARTQLNKTTPRDHLRMSGQKTRRNNDQVNFATLLDAMYMLWTAARRPDCCRNPAGDAISPPLTANTYSSLANQATLMVPLLAHGDPIFNSAAHHRLAKPQSMNATGLHARLALLFCPI